MFWAKADETSNIANLVNCRLCSHNCKIAENNTGFCRVRKNLGGTLYSLVYGKPCSIAVDPIEKKPLFHFAPGSETLSVATQGCNFRCEFCQNWEISQPESEEEITGRDIPPEKLKELINNYPGFSWTYTEPTVFYEYFYETAKLCKDMNKYHVWVTNGYTNEAPIKKAGLDAVNVDYKGDEEFYKKLCSAHLEPVRKSIKAYKKLGVWIEITNLLIPGRNNQEEQIKEMVSFIAGIDKNIPLHFSAYFPRYKLDSQATTRQDLEKAAKIAEEQLNYVYIGNIAHEKGNTYCHNCKALLIKRNGYSSEPNLVKKGKDYHCPSCSAKIPLAGMEWSPFFSKEQ